MSDKRQNSFVSIGSSLLLITFLLLLFMTFAILSFVNARSDMLFSQRMGDSKQEYYIALNNAEQVLCEIKAYLNTGQSVDLNKLKAIDPSIVYADNTISYQIKMNDSQVLDVALSLNPNNSYKITKWQVISTKKWQSEDTIKLMPIL